MMYKLFDTWMKMVETNTVAGFRILYGDESLAEYADKHMTPEEQMAFAQRHPKHASSIFMAGVHDDGSR